MYSPTKTRMKQKQIISEQTLAISGQKHVISYQIHNTFKPRPGQCRNHTVVTATKIRRYPLPGAFCSSRSNPFHIRDPCKGSL